MLIIDGTNYSSKLTAYSVATVVRGEGTIETLSGALYNYGTGTGYNVTSSLEQLATEVLHDLLTNISGPGQTFTASFLADGRVQQERLCKASNITSTLQSTADTGYWALSFELSTVD